MEIKLDCFGEACPVPLRKAQDALGTLKIGDTVLVEVDSKCSAKNVPEWARNEGHTVEVRTPEEGEWEIVISKKR
jgi:TusA-related sulfurtransferase